MRLFAEKKRNWIFAAVAFGVLASCSFAQNAPPKKTKKKQDTSQTDNKQSAEPDKALYDRAMADQKKGRYTEARLSLQTLINTYPDSEYLAKAKLSIADSYYKESGTSNLTLAINEYKDFITFFPFLEESTYAQMQVGMAHYRMMEKADRDRTEAEAAEDEFQTFLLKYPQSPLAPKAGQRLREVQEVLAESDYRIGRFYFLKGDSRAAVPRLLEVTERYPLYSESDQALWMIGSIYDKAEKREVADKFYARIVRDYPGSAYNAEAKKKLMAAGVPVPQPDPAALARMQGAKLSAANDPRPTVMRRGFAAIKSSPDVTHAAKSGNPNLNPPSDIDAGEVLKPTAAGSTIAAKAVGGSENSTAVETVPAGASAPSEDVPDAGSPPDTGVSPDGVPASVSGQSGSIVGNSNSQLPSDAGPPTTAPAETPAASSTGAPGSAVSGSSAPPAATGSATSSASGTSAGAGATATPGESSSGTAAAAAPGTDAAKTAAAKSADCSTATSGSGQSDSSQPCAANPKTESTSKKKKGLHKLVPW
jgi:outer membrane protein assembly factor BamD